MTTTVLALASAIESVLLVADEPLNIRSLARLLEVDARAIDEALSHIKQGEAQRGIHIQRHQGSVQLITAPENADVVRKFLALAHPSRLSRPALETLAIIAYQQPTTRAEIEQLRGVSAERVLATLLARGLIEDVGRRRSAGNPIEYGSTFDFLELFGLRSLSDLPPLERWDADRATLTQLGLESVVANDPSRA